MWIQVRSMDGKTSHQIKNLSKLTKIEELRKILVEYFHIPVDQQRLFYRGKQLEDGYTLFDYDLGLNDIVQILARQTILNTGQSESQASKDTPNKGNKLSDFKKSKENVNGESSENVSSTKYFKVGDIIDAKDSTTGAWFEAKITAIKGADKISKNILHSAENSPAEQKGNTSSSKNSDEDNSVYTVIFEDYEDEESVDLPLLFIRPRARKLLKLNDVNVGDTVMINYNIEDPKERGFWYDCEVTDKIESITESTLIGTLIMGPDETRLDGCKVKFTEEIFAIEKNNSSIDKKASSNVVERVKMPKCMLCNDHLSTKCKQCGCRVCGGKDSPEKQIMCDECNHPYHIWCLKPPLSDIPEVDDWYCSHCKTDETEVVRAGEKLKVSKKKSKMASACASTSRDWGKGMACVGRTKECTIVPQNHFGSIPGIEVGSMWKFRIQVAESGVHRPHVAGIHGREREGAYSIVLSGGYEDDKDNGEEFYYTGSGGRDLSGNKRCADQSCDQTLTRMNKALAMNCNAPVDKDGAKADNWKGGKPVRVVRNCKGKKHSKYCPEEGNRYGGIYKVVKYWPEKGKSGFLVWRYLLRRDDRTPAPWTPEGKKRIKELGLEMQYPEGYAESLKEKEKAAKESTPNQKSKKKRELSDEESSPPKKKKNAYEISKDTLEIIKSDVANQKLWNECLNFINEGKQEFLKKLEVSFQCICCQELVYLPITTACFHNICKVCLKRSFSAQVYTCPMCRQGLAKSIVNKINEKLQEALLLLFPGYDAGR